MNLSATDILLIALLGAVGYFGVSFVIWFWKFRRHAGHGASANGTTREGAAGASSVAPEDHPQQREWYEVLEIDRTATLQEVKAAYRTKIMQYHPDRVESLGPDLRALARNRTQEINEAYEIARKLR